MILVRRGRECAGLAEVRDRELPRLRKLGKPGKDDIKGYHVAAEALWKAQHSKCCYCEQRIREKFNDVEHHRPKARATRGPGSRALHGYWWLAFTWKNLLFACPSCNRSAKNDLFPLQAGSVALRRGQSPPGRELPLLLDPGGSINPVQHIEFWYRAPQADEPTVHPGHQWFARPRNHSDKGNWTIYVCDLNHQDILELRRQHVDTVVIPHAKALNDALAAPRTPDGEAWVQRDFARALGLLDPRVPHVGLTYDALRHHVDAHLLTRRGLAWPAPARVGLPRP